jgi:hypothetical protein
MATSKSPHLPFKDLHVIALAHEACSTRVTINVFADRLTLRPHTRHLLCRNGEYDGKVVDFSIRGSKEGVVCALEAPKAQIAIANEADLASAATRLLSDALGKETEFYSYG